ncbi:MAG TPA: glutaredoxin, partial [Flavobacteriales bacterium]|nr:glutaredoxin [Flavobacteriales bacterium]
MKQVTVFSKTNCGWCDLAKGTLKKLGIKFIETNLDDDKYMKECFDHYNVSSVPQILIGDDLIGGYSDLWKLVKPTIDYNLLG